MFSLRVQPTIKSQTQTTACTDAVIYALSKYKEKNKKNSDSTQWSLIKVSEVGFLPRRKVLPKFGVTVNKAKNKIIWWCQPIRFSVTC